MSQILKIFPNKCHQIISENQPPCCFWTGEGNLTWQILSLCVKTPHYFVLQVFGNSILDTRAFIVQLGKKQFNSTFFSERSKAHKSICRKEMSFSSVAAFVQNVSNCSPAHWLFRLARIIMQMLLVASYCLGTSAPSFPFPCLFSLVAHGGPWLASQRDVTESAADI